MVVSTSAAAPAPPQDAPETGDDGRTHRIDADEQSREDPAVAAERQLVRRQMQAQAQELAMDRIRKTFDVHEAERAELLREWNAMRDLAMEQMKHDDEILKKWIALI